MEIGGYHNCQGVQRKMRKINSMCHVMIYISVFGENFLSDCQLLLELSPLFITYSKVAWLKVESVLLKNMDISDKLMDFIFLFPKKKVLLDFYCYHFLSEVRK